MNLEAHNARIARAASPSLDRPTWHRIYYVLAIFDICALCVSLYVNHRIMQIYIESVADDRSWVEIRNDASQLGELAASINAPGNDVFQSRDVAAESAKLRQAYLEFKDRCSSLGNSLVSQPSTEQIGSMLEDLKTVRSATAQMVRDAKLTLAFLEAEQVDQATKHMASMDRRYSTVNSTLVRLRKRISAVQNDQFTKQTAAAAMLQKSEYLIAGMITFMIVGATVYGRVIARQVALATRLKETYRSELEERVEERTADLQAANQARAELLQLLISAQEDERRRIARDLHDGVGQALTYLVVGLRRLEDGESGRVRAEAGQLREVTSQALEDVRRLARGLRPSVLDDLGLQPALERLVSDFAAGHPIVIELENTMPTEPRLPEAIETALYRIVQEALTNIAKHSGATKASVRLERRADIVYTIVQDNGRGFDVDTSVGVLQAAASVGLSSIRERASILGGDTVINSRPDTGTSVRISIPIASAEIETVESRHVESKV